MSVLSRRGRLAIAAVVDIAIYGRQAPVAAKALAQRHALPPRHLEPLLQGLVRAGILKGLRGPRGGYDIARDRRKISCGEIARAVATASEDEPEEIALLVTTVVEPAIAEAERRFFAELDRISIAELCATVEAQPSLAVA
ncbi:RrF2 family transcriptional regulator [Phreatobacter stygius]|uniref:Rrf2 family transcriptional regulator n=1 Tax=Phreatobacter stygius TaxID=1940610 RepID=A0A4D7AWD3_9HYPH|nr:Rrf2 family transcriptional regulator [Phreatobacter stygius]QCI65389.1 Rrf2 family transcriptional regulator [Phreatobacter stygius]